MTTVDPAITRAIERLREGRNRVYVVATGAGAGIQEALWSVPGCSSFFVGAQFPYHASETEEFLGFVPDHYASEETAIDLATAAYLRAIDPSDATARPFGVAVTASVATLEAHRGAHRAHVAVVAGSRVFGTTLVLEKGVGREQRARDGAAVDGAVLNALLVAAGVRDGAIDDWSARGRDRFFARPYWTADGRRLGARDVPVDAALFPGAFDPPHAGHFAIADAAGARRAVFAICADPPNKAPLDLGAMLRRARLLRGRARLFTEGDALYLDKARRFPGRTFLIGSDALVRMLDARWGIEADALLTELATLDARFEVTGRLVDGAFLSAHEAIDRHVPKAFRARFVPVSGRWDTSSTALRAATAQATG